VWRRWRVRGTSVTMPEVTFDVWIDDVAFF
jgi:hypothetical protein